MQANLEFWRDEDGLVLVKEQVEVWLILDHARFTIISSAEFAFKSLSFRFKFFAAGEAVGIAGVVHTGSGVVATLWWEFWEINLIPNTWREFLLSNINPLFTALNLEYEEIVFLAVDFAIVA